MNIANYPAGNDGGELMTSRPINGEQSLVDQKWFAEDKSGI